MTAASLRRLFTGRPVAIGGLLLVALAVALLLGRWLAIVQAPLTRQAVATGLLESGAAHQAAYVFETPAWQGVALYRAGRYQRAAEAFARDHSVTALYDLGNAYARLGLYQGAMAAYQAVIERQPNHEDARFNLELVRAAAQRAQELAEANRENEVAADAGDGATDNQGDTEEGSDPADQTGAGDESASSEDGEPGGSEQDTSAGMSETATPDALSGDGLTGDIDREAEEIDSSVFSLSGSDDPAAEDERPDGDFDDAKVLGGVVDRAREDAMADEIVLRRIKDDPELVLKARLAMALKRQRAER